jgi:hypothetical protein
MARQELNIAEALAPDLPFANRESVQALQRELSRAQSARARPVESQAQSSVPWSTAAIVLIVGAFVLWLILRRRNPPTSVYSQYPGQYPAPMSPPAGVPGNPVGTGVAPSTGGGLGSAVAGGLATGLGVGAGLVAGEALAGHLLGSGEQQRNAPLPVNEPPDNASNADPGNDDMGGRDFGLSDDNSWGDDSGGLGGVDGGDDWT